MTNESSLPKSFHRTQKIDFTKPIETETLKDKNVIITGGANGLGAGCVHAMAKAGAFVTILDVNVEKGTDLADVLTKEGHRVQFVKTDVTSFESQNAGFKSAIAFHPKNTLDIVLTSAGISAFSISTWLEDNIASADPEPTPPKTAVLDINLLGTFHSAHLALYYFRKTLSSSSEKTESQNPSKQLIFVSSLAGYVPLNNVCDYQATKFGVRGIWKSLRRSVDILASDTPFRTNLIAPTFIKTDMTASLEPLLTAKGLRMGSVDDVVAGVLRLACDETIFGRAIAIAASEKDDGDKNFDLDDDWEGLDAGRETRGKIIDGTIGGLQNLEYRW